MPPKPKVTSTFPENYAHPFHHVPCPIHGLKLHIQQTGNRRFAICDCDIPKNKWLGKPVWEQITKGE